MNDLIRGALSSLFISIPETTFMVLLLIRFSGRKELLDVYRFKENIKWYIILIVPPSILIDVLNYGFKIKPRGITVIVCLLLLYVLTIYVFKKTEYETVENLYFKVFIRIIPIYFILIILDLSNAFVWFKLLNLTYVEISKDIYLVLLCSLSSRIIEIMILIFILLNRNSKFQINILNSIYKNAFFKKFIAIIMSSLLIFEIYVVKLILFNNLLNIITSLLEQIFFIIFITYFIPALTLTSIYILIKYCITVIYDGKQER